MLGCEPRASEDKLTPELSPVAQWAVPLCLVPLEVLDTGDLVGQAGLCCLGAHTQLGREI